MNNMVECVAISLIIGAIIIIYLRAGKKQISLSMLPLLFVPVLHIISCLAVWGFKIGGSMQYNMYIIFDLTGLALSALVSGLCSKNFRKKFAVIYMAVVLLFCVALSAILITNNLQ